MSDKIPMLNPGVGITGVTTPTREDISISSHKGGMSPALSLSGNEQGLEAYNEHNLDSIVDNYLHPKSADPDLMAPHVFQRTLQGALGKLSSLDDSNPLAEMNSDISHNNEIIRMFTSLVIPG